MVKVVVVLVTVFLVVLLLLLVHLTSLLAQVQTHLYPKQNLHYKQMADSINQIRKRGFPQDLETDRSDDITLPGEGFDMDMEDPNSNTLVDLQDGTNNG
jgi:predicted PurR-regulated permease PerM